MDRVIWESRHKFVYYDEFTRDMILDSVSRYPGKMNSEEPIVVYVKDDGLTKGYNYDKLVNVSFHNRYFELLIFLSIIDMLIKSIDIDILNDKLKRLFRICSYTTNKKVSDVVELRLMLSRSIDVYKEAYIKYQENGELDFYDKLEIPFIMMDNVLECLKKELNLEKYFSLLIEIDNDNIYNQMAINDYIASRCNGYLSVNVLCNEYEWRTYYSSNNQLIENVHDYTVVDLRRGYKKKRFINK